ncbi:hypothetical protein C6497_08500 [Candidatus Poribacteria bacterium]|nr:MAG: hypothetical protein C6497_08500 [Candidatus Poribacteria bacterium]
MKNVLLLSIFFCTIALPTLADLTSDNLNQIRLIVKEEIEDVVKPIKVDIDTIKTEIGSVKENVASLNGRVGGLEKQMIFLMAIIVVTVGIPQVILTWRTKRERAQERQIDTLTREIELLKQQRIVNP